jgi:lipopolysaccharide transport system ATP-binding protein
MPSDIAVSIRNLSKTYEFHASAGARFLALLAGRRHGAQLFQALKPISLDIPKGAFFGILGQNGSGKSTLLQLISGIVTPSSGTVQTQGKIAALLELGAGFNPEFTGRENARLNAQILGVSQSVFEKLLPDIEAFADIGDFIDRPVKTYSSGMFVRLAFAVQACISPDILIVDEALAVGDVFFRLKCYERLSKLRADGCTVILVTHSMEDVLQYCDKAVLLHHGECVYLGDPNEAINRYYALGRSSLSSAGILPSESAQLSDVHWFGKPREAFVWPSALLVDTSAREQMHDAVATCLAVGVTDTQLQQRQVFHQGDTAVLFVEFEVHQAIGVPVGGVVLRTDKGVVVHGKNTGQIDCAAPAALPANSRCRFRFELDLAVGQGEYLIDFGFASWPEPLYARRESATMAELESSATRHCVLSAALTLSVVPKGQFGFAVQPFYGISGLRSSGAMMPMTLNEISAL